MTDYQHIEYAVDDGILTITLDRPDRLNAFTSRMGHELCDAFDRSDADDAVRAVVMTGRGRAFCAGMDLGGGSSTFDVEAKGGPSVDEYRERGRGRHAADVREQEADHRGRERRRRRRGSDDDARRRRAPGR